MKKYLIFYALNTSFWNSPNKYIESVVTPTLNNWIINALDDCNIENYRIVPISSKKLLFTETFPIKEQQKVFNEHSFKHQQIYYVFNSLYDINPNIRKALKYIHKLQAIGYIVYVLSINPIEDCTKYLEDFANYNGIYNLNDTRDRSEKYSPILLDFATDLRLASPPVKYSVITSLTGIPKGTLISYMKRKKRFQNNSQTGRNYLTDEENVELQSCIDCGALINYRK
ncbi:MAG: hypothetical protein Q4B53_05135 [Lachnospiraceae bacterium]|nr:hypothetical protein [Lachnospiraceae bacterium]